MSLDSIDIGLRELLRDPKRRQEFFKAIVQDEIASQIRALRKKRNLNQTELAATADMKQSAVSRIEQAEYSSWTLTTLLRVAAALDARWRMVLQPSEEAIKEYEGLGEASTGVTTASRADAALQAAEGEYRARTPQQPRSGPLYAQTLT